MRRFPLAAVISTILLSLVSYAVGADKVPYGVGDWPESLGNHRARIRVAEKTEAV